MRHQWKVGLSLLVGLGLLAMPISLRGDETPKPAGDKGEARWRPLFDGKRLDGWRNWKKETASANWKVIDGAMVKDKGGGDLETREEFDYFELLIDYKIEPAGNSGVMFWVQAEGTEPGWSGPEVQLLDNDRGGDPTKSGWLYGLYQPANDPKTGKPLDATNPAGQWNTLRIVVAPAGETSAIWMNGVKYEEWVFDSADWKARVAKSKFGAAPAFAKNPKGHIVLQEHGAEVAFRNIKIRQWKNPGEDK